MTRTRESGLSAVQHAIDGKLRVYLDVILKGQPMQAQAMFLPSLMALSRLFNCTAADLHRVLNELKDYHAFIVTPDAPITLSYT